MKILFYLSIVMIIYAYFGYPITLLIIRLISGKNGVQKGLHSPNISVIITAYNEEANIRQKIENTLCAEYPEDRLQIVVVSDGSTDRTNEIVREYESRGVDFVPIKIRVGKENAQKEALKHTRGEIIIFTDVASSMQRDGLVEIVQNFVDPVVGCVSSVDKVCNDYELSGGERLYVSYEMFLRKLESQVYSIVGVSGSFFALRSEICKYLQGDMQSDFSAAIYSIKLGLRAVSDETVQNTYKEGANIDDEFERKVRTVIRGMTVFFRHLDMLNIVKYGLFSYCLCCHKLLRWLVPFFLITAFVTNAVIAPHYVQYLIVFIVQIMFYGAALIGMLSNRGLTIVAKIPRYFTIVNSAILVAWWKYLTGERIVTWEPTER
ncbi:MAG: glycosyltransferase [Syntrophales bacterium]|nr:glycosyltransferase [Syntrophales bacterium]